MKTHGFNIQKDGVTVTEVYPKSRVSVYLGSNQTGVQTATWTKV